MTSTQSPATSDTPQPDAPVLVSEANGVLTIAVSAVGAGNSLDDDGIAAGTQAVMVFDTWGGTLTPEGYRDFSLAYMQRIVDGVTRESEGRRVPVTLFTKGGGAWLESMAGTGCDALGLDWTIDIDDARRRVGERVALQGNLDPAVLYASAGRVREEVRKILDAYGPGPGHVFNLGHGIHPTIDPENVAALVDEVHARRDR